jgi:hypothetical protein
VPAIKCDLIAVFIKWSYKDSLIIQTFQIAIGFLWSFMPIITIFGRNKQAERDHKNHSFFKKILLLILVSVWDFLILKFLFANILLREHTCNCKKALQTKNQRIAV